MTIDTDDLLTDELPADDAVRRSPLTVGLVAIIAVCVLAVAVAVGYVVGGHGKLSSASAGVSTSSVDAGFARDMSTHHTQAVTMAGYERDHTTNPLLKTIAFDIETSQEQQVGEMQGWLDVWGLNRTETGAQMTWMSGHPSVPAGDLMPGMATSAQLDTLESETGPKMDILFLQLMIHHHQGGIIMAQYASQHATQSYVRTLAGDMYTEQTNEILQMEQLLLKMGGTTLPAPSD